MSYSYNGVGSYYLNGLGVDAGCDLAQQFDPVQVAAWITKAGQNCGNECNAAGKKYTYWVVAALWRLGYTTAGFDMSITPAGYVSWGDAQASAYRAWRRNRTGTSGSYFPAAAEMQALKEDLLNDRVTGPNPPKIVCISGDTAVDITPVAVQECPTGWTGTPPNCVPPPKEEPAKQPSSCPTGYTGTPPNCVKKTATCPTGYELKAGKCVKVVAKAGMGVWPWLLLGAGGLALVGLALSEKKPGSATVKVQDAVAPKLTAAKTRIRRAGSAAKRKILAVVPKGMRVRQVALKANRRRRRRRAR